MDSRQINGDNDCYNNTGNCFDDADNHDHHYYGDDYGDVAENNVRHLNQFDNNNCNPKEREWLHTAQSSRHNLCP